MTMEKIKQILTMAAVGAVTIIGSALYIGLIILNLAIGLGMMALGFGVIYFAFAWLFG